ncbi:MAG: glycoside hydrolase family 130 protein [Isosphaeraceae bacterium]
MISRKGGTVLLRPEDLEPSHPDFEVVGVFNPGAAVIAGEVVLLVRVAERPRERREGSTPLPRWEPGEGPVIDWVSDLELEPVDPRVVRGKADGLIRLTFLSHLRVVRCGNGQAVRGQTSFGLWPESNLEEYGVEDPRITLIDDRFWITYVSVSRHGAATSLASTRDFQSFTRHGVIFCVENKDVVLFPEKAGGEYVALHRPNGATPFTRPEIWLARSSDLIHWGGHEPLSWGAGTWESGRVGAGPPPIRTSEGWLTIYHGNRRPAGKGEVGAYSAGALLLDLEHPNRVLKRTPEAFFSPTTEFERSGFVPEVVFPTGVVKVEDRLLVYYGAADSCTAVVEFSRSELIGVLR